MPLREWMAPGPAGGWNHGGHRRPNKQGWMPRPWRTVAPAGSCRTRRLPGGSTRGVWIMSCRARSRRRVERSRLNCLTKPLPTGRDALTARIKLSARCLVTDIVSLLKPGDLLASRCGIDRRRRTPCRTPRGGAARPVTRRDGGPGRGTAGPAGPARRPLDRRRAEVAR